MLDTLSSGVAAAAPVFAVCLAVAVLATASTAADSIDCRSCVLDRLALMEFVAVESRAPACVPLAVTAILVTEAAAALFRVCVAAAVVTVATVAANVTRCPCWVGLAAMTISDVPSLAELSLVALAATLADMEAVESIAPSSGSLRLTEVAVIRTAPTAAPRCPGWISSTIRLADVLVIDAERLTLAPVASVATALVADPANDVAACRWLLSTVVAVVPSDCPRSRDCRTECLTVVPSRLAAERFADTIAVPVERIAVRLTPASLCGLATASPAAAILPFAADVVRSFLAVASTLAPVVTVAPPVALSLVAVLARSIAIADVASLDSRSLA